MKKTAIAVAVFVLAVLMVLPVVRSVNLSAGKPVTVDGTLSADGWQQPPLPPSLAESLMAEGGPLPWPHVNAFAEGSPLPWPHLRSDSANSTLMAEGSPLPWPHLNAFAEGSPLPWPHLNSFAV